MKRTPWAVVVAVLVSSLVWPSVSVTSARAASAGSGRLIFSASGNGISNTRRFQVPGTWRIAYSFSHCQIPGFDVYVKGGPDDMGTDGRSSGTGLQYEYGSGNIYLTLNTACSWHIAVYAGNWVVNGIGLTLSGNNITNTIAFRVPSEWTIRYRFWNCSIPGFDIYVGGSVDDITSKQGNGGSGVQYEHGGGTVHLTVNTACYWRISISK